MCSGWTKRSLDELAVYHNGRAFKPSEWTESGLPIVRIAQITNPNAEPHHYDGDDVDAKHIIDNADLLFSWSATLAVLEWKNGPAILNQHIFKVVENKGVCREFLRHLLQHSLPALADRSHGSTMKHIRKGVLKEHLVSVPPLRKQRKIAAILSSVDDAIEKTQAVIDQVRVVKRGLMQELLTRGLPGWHTQFKQTEIGEIPREWESTRLGSRVELQPGFPFKSQNFSADGDRLLRGSNVGVGRLIWTDDKTKYFPPARRAEVKDYELQEGDIVVAMDRPFISGGFKIATVTVDDLPALLLQRVGRFRTFRELVPNFLWQLLQSRYVKTHLQISQKGTDLPHISKTEIESSICPFPPADEQERIATYLGTLDMYASRLEQERLQTNLLKASLMSVLLTGELRVARDTEAA